RATELDALAPIIDIDLRLVYVYQRDYDAAIEHCKRMVKVFPDTFQAHLYLGWAYTQKKMYPDAAAEYKHATQMSNGYSLALAMKGYNNAVSGHRAEALKMIKQLQELRSRGGNVPGVRFALLYTALGDKDKAFE